MCEFTRVYIHMHTCTSTRGVGLYTYVNVLEYLSFYTYIGI